MTNKLSRLYISITIIIITIITIIIITITTQ